MTHGVIGGVTWSLALEMQFYVALIFGINQLLRLGPWRTLALLVGVSWFWRWGLTLLLKPAVADSHLQWIYTAQLPGTLDAFGMGITLALVLVRGGQGGLVRLLAPSWPHCVFWLGLSAAMLWASGAVLLQNRNYWEIIGMIVFWRTGLAVGFAAALCAVLSCPLTGTGWLRPFRYLGEISYGLYIWHFPVLLALVTRPDLRGGTLFVLVLAGSVILASLSWHLMEKHWILGSGKV